MKDDKKVLSEEELNSVSGGIASGGRVRTGGDVPLYVVDGMPMVNEFDINPDDIETIPVLKDMSVAGCGRVK